MTRKKPVKSTLTGRSVEANPPLNPEEDDEDWEDRGEIDMKHSS